MFCGNRKSFICLSGYTCALQKDILYQGRMFVSDHWICFHSKVFGKDTKVQQAGACKKCCGNVHDTFKPGCEPNTALQPCFSLLAKPAENEDYRKKYINIFTRLQILSVRQAFPAHVTVRPLPPTG